MRLNTHLQLEKEGVLADPLHNKEWLGHKF